jgi:glycosyltransferase involved in cell wall biosynthesis
MRKSGWEVLMVSSFGREIPQVEKAESCRYEIIPFSKQKFSVVEDFKSLWLLFNLFKKERPDIVHSSSSKAGLLSMIAAKLAGVKLRIHTVEEPPQIAKRGEKKTFFQRLEHLMYDLATDIWPTSNALKSLILENEICSREKLQIIHRGSINGVDLSKFNRQILKENHLVAATMRILPREEDFIVLFVGNLTVDEGIIELVKAFLKFKFQKQAKLVLLGSYEKGKNQLPKEIISVLEENPRIVQIDSTDHVASYMALSDVLVCPFHRIGFPNILLEAGAMQLPIICTDVSAGDFLSPSKHGLIFPVGDVQALQEALRAWRVVC